MNSREHNLSIACITIEALGGMFLKLNKLVNTMTYSVLIIPQSNCNETVVNRLRTMFVLKNAVRAYSVLSATYLIVFINPSL